MLASSSQISGLVEEPAEEPFGQMVTLKPATLSGVSGMSICSTPPPPDLRSVPASVGAFVWMKSRPSRVTRAAAAFGTCSLAGNARPIGVMPAQEHPLEQPPPLHAATTR